MFQHPKLSHELTKKALKQWKLSEKYSADEVDLWPLACTLFYASSGNYPFPHHHQEPNIYHQAVSKCPKGSFFFKFQSKLYLDSISAKIINGTNDVQFDFQKEIENQRYPKWFRVAFSTLIRSLLHEPSMLTYERIANGL